MTGDERTDLPHIFCLADEAALAQSSLKELHARYRFARDPSSAKALIALGGDGFMLDVMHRFIDSGLPVYGMNRGTVGFMMNSYRRDNLGEAISRSRRISLNPLRAEVITRSGDVHHCSAFNEVSLLRETRQAAKLRVTIDDKVRIPELVGDGALICTPAGSTAYNLSANGPVIPLGTAMLGLTPISPFRPRRWRGALLPLRSEITLEVINPEKRPVSAVADFTEIRNIAKVHVRNDTARVLNLLFDKGHSLEERIFNEQFIH